MNFSPKSVICEVLSSFFTSIILFLWTSGPIFVTFALYCPTCAFPLVRFLLDSMDALVNDYRAGMGSKWQIRVFNWSTLLSAFYIFAADYVIGFQDKSPLYVTFAIKLNYVLTYLTYLRYYWGLFNLELSFPFITNALESVLAAFVWHTYKGDMLITSLAILAFQIVVNVLIFPEQKKKITCIYCLPYKQWYYGIREPLYVDPNAPQPQINEDDDEKEKKEKMDEKDERKVKKD